MFAMRMSTVVLVPFILCFAGEGEGGARYKVQGSYVGGAANASLGLGGVVSFAHCGRTKYLGGVWGPGGSWQSTCVVVVSDLALGQDRNSWWGVTSAD